MSITIHLDLTKSVATGARARGLLDPASVSRLIERELAEAEDSRTFIQRARAVRSVLGDPMTMDEIQRVVD